MDNKAYERSTSRPVLVSGKLGLIGNAREAFYYFKRDRLSKVGFRRVALWSQEAQWTSI